MESNVCWFVTIIIQKEFDIRHIILEIAIIELVDFKGPEYFIGVGKYAYHTYYGRRIIMTVGREEIWWCD